MTEHGNMWVPDGVDTSRASVAGVYDYLLGGSHIFASDRVVAERLEETTSGIRQAARVNRAFLGRAVRHMIDCGVRLFLDFGSGFPTMGPAHEIAQAIDPACRVVYVDRNPIVVAFSEKTLRANDHATVVCADIRTPTHVLHSSAVRRLLDLHEPIGLLCLAVLHWLPDDHDLFVAMARYRDALPPGSYLAISHATGALRDAIAGNVAEVINTSRIDGNIRLRGYSDVMAMFGDFEFVDPGLVAISAWRPGGPGDLPQDSEMGELAYAGIAVKPPPPRTCRK